MGHLLAQSTQLEQLAQQGIAALDDFVEGGDASLKFVYMDEFKENPNEVQKGKASPKRLTLPPFVSNQDTLARMRAIQPYSCLSLL